MRYDPDLFDDLPEVDIHDLSRNGRDSSSRNVNQGEDSNASSSRGDHRNRKSNSKRKMSSRNTKDIKNPTSIREASIITYLFLLMFLGMILYFVYFMSLKSDSFIASSYNPRMTAQASKLIRGSIETSDGKVIAQSKVNADGSVERNYPYNDLYAHAVGYTIKGMSGLEKTENFSLLECHSSFLLQIQNDLEGKKNTGDTVVSTLHSKLQEVSYNALGDSDGAVITMDPSTGKILSMVSKPDFNPNTLASNWEELTSEDSTSSALLNRATQGQYAPGSTFKIVTALEYLREGHSLRDSFTCKGSYTNDGYTVHCAANEKHGEETTESAFANSCNVAFSQMGLTLDQKKWKTTAEELLFNTNLPKSLGTSKKSSFAIDGNADQATVMATAFGQGKTIVSPAHMLLLTSAIANDGVLMEPTLVDSIRSADSSVTKTIDKTKYKTLMSKEEASVMQSLMRSVVTEGTATKLHTDAYTAYGKTGSAEYETGSKDTHSWFVGYCNVNGRKLAIAVIAEGQGYGSSYAVPVAKKVFDTFSTLEN